MSGQWSFPAEVSYIGTARSVVGEYAAGHGVAEPPLGDLKLALTEAVTNTVVHAYRFGDPGSFTVAIVVERRSVLITVVDDGVGMQPRADSPGLGLGLRLINTVATATHVGTPPSGRGTEIRMSFALAG